MKCLKLISGLMVEVVLTVIEENMNFLANVITYWIFVCYCQIGAFSSLKNLFMLMILFSISCDNEKVKNLAKSNYCFSYQ